MNPDRPADDEFRLDKWLWAARIFKTRSVAKEAVEGGKVRVGGRRVKAARRVGPGDLISFDRRGEEHTIVVRLLSRRRGPAASASEMYEETAESLSRRSARNEPDGPSGGRPVPGGRPDKADRRLWRRMTGDDD